MSEFTEKLIKEAEDLVLNKFPKIIIELNELMEDESLNVKSMKEIKSDVNIPIPKAPTFNNDHKEPNLKKRKVDDCDGEIMGTHVYVLPNGVSPSNNKLTKLIELVKPRIRQLVEDTNMLKMWILFLIPRIEDGNNFGVSIQEETLGEIRAVESESAAYFDQISRYFMSRGKVITKIAKYPHVEDFRKTLEEIDEKEYVSLRLVVAELRNHYATLYDMVTKNLEKIRRPRNSNAEAMF
ncbi:Proteasome activator complex subunit 3-like protein [Leptotrombidium deliense]|uniref:Proteasome activator complex subunit 3-like protein n=1 Tax=Leptotrombidium deliense TaxID=299467 RepID=A0A443SE30_9ACAR|nr:Proteasome activator complex subunit 3-like protein [Leptotrombidium deliense]